MSKTIHLTVPVFSTLCNQAFALRRLVFVMEQKVPEIEEFDSDDLTAVHWVAISDGEISGTLRVITTDAHIKIGRVAVVPSFRGQGIASDLLRFAMDACRKNGQTRFYLTAQSDKVKLYEKLGFTAFGEEFLDGGMPHFAMKTY